MSSIHAPSPFSPLRTASPAGIARLALALLAAAGTPHATAAQELDAPAAPAAAAPVAPLDVEAAAAYSAGRAGLAVLVYENGELVFERYQNGHGVDKAQHVFSGTKSFAPMVALVAQAEGLLELDEKVADTIHEWRGDAKRGAITIRHLLNFTSGLENIDRTLHSPRTADAYAAAVACAGQHEPGTRFRYGSNHLTVFGELFRRKLAAASTGERPLPADFVGYLNARILEPIGCEHARWIRDRAGNPMLPYGASLTAREWAKFGLLVLNRGRHGDAQVIPAEHFDECFVGSEANRRYGLNFWLVGNDLHRRNPRVPRDTVTAAGMYDQRLYIVPSRDLLVVRLGRTGARSSFGDAGFLDALFGRDPADAEAHPRRGR